MYACEYYVVFLVAAYLVVAIRVTTTKTSMLVLLAHIWHYTFCVSIFRAYLLKCGLIMIGKKLDIFNVLCKIKQLNFCLQFKPKIKK